MPDGTGTGTDGLPYGAGTPVAGMGELPAEEAGTDAGGAAGGATGTDAGGAAGGAAGAVPYGATGVVACRPELPVPYGGTEGAVPIGAEGETVTVEYTVTGVHCEAVEEAPMGELPVPDWAGLVPVAGGAGATGGVDVPGTIGAGLYGWGAGAGTGVVTGTATGVVVTLGMG